MIAQVPAKFLNTEGGSFTDTATGRLVEYARITVLDYPDMNALKLPLDMGLYNAGVPFDKLQDVVLTIDISQRNNNVRLRVMNVQAGK